MGLEINHLQRERPGMKSTTKTRGVTGNFPCKNVCEIWILVRIRPVLECSCIAAGGMYSLDTGPLIKVEYQSLILIETLPLRVLL